MSVDISEINHIDYFTIEEIALLYAGINPFLPNINIPSLINSEPSAKLINRGLIDPLEAGEFKKLKIRYIEQPVVQTIVDNQTKLELVISDNERKFNGNSLIKISRKEIAKWFTKSQYEQPLFLHRAKELPEGNYRLALNNDEIHTTNDRTIYNKLIVYLVNLIINLTTSNKYGTLRNPNLSQIRDSINEYAEKYRFNSKPEGLASSDKKIANSFEAIYRGSTNVLFNFSISKQNKKSRLSCK